jgi:hypothetical protein
VLINGAVADNVTNTGNELVISRKFSTVQSNITAIAIRTQPSNLTYTHGMNLNLAGLVVTLTLSDTTTRDVALANFASEGIITEPANNAVLSHTVNNGQAVKVSATGSIYTQTATLTVNPASITTAAITITAPQKGMNPVTTAPAGGTGYTCGNVSWTPAHSPFLGSEKYTAEVTLTSDANHIFAATLAATINTNNAVVTIVSQTSVRVSYEFPPTDDREVASLTIKTQPALVYTHGNQLNLSALVATINYDDNTTEDVAFEDFYFKNITTEPTHYAQLTHVDNDGKPVVVIFNNSDTIRVNTDNLTVNKGTRTFPAHAPVSGVFTPTLTLSNLTLDENYAWVNGGTSLSAGYNQTFQAAYTDPSGNFEPVNGNITVNISRAAGSPVSKPTEMDVTAYSITVNPVTVLENNLQSVEYSISRSPTVYGYTWQSGVEFIELDPGTEYFVHARSASNDNYIAGTPNVSEGITTMTPAGFTITVTDMFDNGSLSLNLSGRITVSRSGAPVEIRLLGDYNESNVRWVVPGMPEDHFKGPLLILDGRDVRYNQLGVKFITLYVMKNSAWFSQKIEIEVVR